MARMKYGADVRYVTCKREDLKTVPLIDGQIITFLNADGIFYDIEGTRHTVGNFLTVNELPEFGIENTLYVVFTKDDEDTVLPMNICIWSESEQLYYKLIPEPMITEDAPDDSWYLRTKGKWCMDKTIFYVNEDWDAYTCFQKLQSFITQFARSSKVIKVSGALKLNRGYVLDAPTHLDLSSCVMYTDDDSLAESFEDDWFYIKIVNSHGVSRLSISNAWIILDSEPIASGRISVYDCMLWDSRVDISGSMNGVTIRDNTFICSNRDIVPLINSEKKSVENTNALYVFNNQFSSDVPVNFAMFIDSRRENIVDKNLFTRSIPLSRKKSSSLDISTNIAPGQSILEDSEILDCNDLNSTTILDLGIKDSAHLDIDLILSLAKKQSNYNLFNVGKTFIASDVFLGVADMKQSHVIFEVMPNTVNIWGGELALDILSVPGVRCMKIGEMIDISGKRSEDIRDIMRGFAANLNFGNVDRLAPLLDFGKMFDVYKYGKYEKADSTYPEEYDKGYPGNIDIQLYEFNANEENVFAVYQDVQSEMIGSKILSEEELSKSDVRYVIEVETEV